MSALTEPAHRGRCTLARPNESRAPRPLRGGPPGGAGTGARRRVPPGRRGSRCRLTGRPGPDAYDADLAAARGAVYDLGVGLTVWSYRREPDAHARRAANDALDAIDAALAALHRIRARLVTEVRRADDETAVRVDELLARRRDGPRQLTPTGDRPTSSPAKSAEVMRSQATPGRRQSGDP